MTGVWSPIERKCLYLLQQRKSLRLLLQIHGFIICNNVDTNLNIVTKFISACSLIPGGIRHARQLFDKSPLKNDSFFCNVMIKAHNDNHQFDEALLLFRVLMRMPGFKPNNYTFMFLTKSCCSNLYNLEGRQLHSLVIKTGFCLDVLVSTSVVDMYAKMCDMSSSQMVFDEMPVRNVVSWTALVCGYARSGYIFHARKYFDQMPDKDVSAYNAIIDAYVKVWDMKSALGLFEMMPEKNVVSYTTMICGFCDDNDTQSARLVFDIMPLKNIVSWNAMIDGYFQNKQSREAIELFHDLLRDPTIEVNEVTIVSVLPAIADLGALDMGCWVHDYVKSKRLDKKIKISTLLIDMYAKCGEINKAMSVFKMTPRKVTCTWNAILNGLAVNGYGKEALVVFDEMISKNYKPNSITMLGVLSACSHSGLVEEGKKWLKEMQTSFGLTPQIKHYDCVIDLLSRIGELDEAEKELHSVSYDANEILISSFLSAFVNQNDLNQPDRVLDEALEENKLNVSNNVLLRNLYAMEKRTDVKKVKGFMMRNSGVKKETGFSVIEANGMLWEFISGSSIHPQFEGIAEVLRVSPDAYE